MLVKVGNIGDIVTNGLATTYPPGMNKESFEKMKNKVRGCPRVPCFDA
jgi:hypothetical protein